MNFTIIAVGQLKKGPEKDLIDFYHKQTSPKIKIIEIDARKHSQTEQWHKALIPYLETNGVNIFMDETGKSLSSRDLSKTLKNLSQTQSANINFFIGGADGFNKDFIKKHAVMTLCLGKMTMPHMLARVVLVEQLYRVQKIMAGHPYHRD